jgi:glycine dehydrogenase
MSWPVHGTLMVEPTESESLEEIDRFCDAMLAIADEVEEIARGEIAIEESALRNAPHTYRDLSGSWERRYTREQAAFPAPWLHERKFWPSVGRIDNVFGDRNVVCTCAPLEAYRDTIDR